jgi:hypothetical protein
MSTKRRRKDQQRWQSSHPEPAPEPVEWKFVLDNNGVVVGDGYSFDAGWDEVQERAEQAKLPWNRSKDAMGHRLPGHFEHNSR